MAQYVDGFVIPIRRQNFPAYKRPALAASKVLRDHGGLAHRNPRITGVEVTTMPFDVRRMLYGGFTTIVEL